MTLFNDIETMLNLEVSASNFQDVHKRAGLSQEEKELVCGLLVLAHYVLAH